MVVVEKNSSDSTSSTKQQNPQDVLTDDDDNELNKSKRLRSNDSKEERHSKYGIIDTEPSSSSSINNNENLLLIAKNQVKYSDEMYGPQISPALTNTDSLIIMHHFNEEHPLSSSGLSSSSSSLLRTSSNSSSSSSASSSNTNNTTNSTNDNSNINNSANQILIPNGANQLIENFKKLITNPQNENLLLSDQLALMMRSRSSSDESSSSSSVNSNQNLNYHQQQQMKTLFQIQQNFLNGELDNVLLSNYLNPAARGGYRNNNNNKIMSPQNHYHEELFNRLTNNKLTKIDESINDATSMIITPPLPPPTTITTSPNMTLIKQMLNSYNQQIKKEDEQEQHQSIINYDKLTPTKADNEKNTIESVVNLNNNELDIKNEEIKAKLNSVVNKVGNNIVQSSSSTSVCKVCGDEASGFHYGVDSCEGCKGFFRRCITQGMNHHCTNNMQCEVTPFSRNSCQYCRLKKCFFVGMSRDASRLGRRPKRPREEQWANVKNGEDDAMAATNDIRVKYEQMQHETNQSVEKNQKKDESPKTSKSKSKETPNKKNSSMDLSSISSSLNSIPNPPFNLDHKLLNNNQEDFNDEKLKFQKNDPFKNFEFSKNQTVDISIFLNFVQVADEHLNFERSSQLEYYRCTIIEAYSLLWPTTQLKIQAKLRENIPILKPKFPQDSIILNDSIETIVPLIMDVVKCSKYIPGFVDIQQHDQVQLLKQGSFEVICVNSFNLIDIDKKLMLSQDLKYLMDSTDIKSMPLGFFMIDVFELCLKTSSLKLTDDEVALFNALLISNPNREGLTDRKKVQELQATLMHVLYRHLKRFRPDDDQMFSKLLKLIPILGKLNNKHSDAINKLQTNESRVASTSNETDQ